MKSQLSNATNMVSNRDKHKQNKAMKKLNKIEERKAIISQEEEMLLQKLEKLNKKKQQLDEKYSNLHFREKQNATMAYTTLAMPQDIAAVIGAPIAPKSKKSTSQIIKNQFKTQSARTKGTQAAGDRDNDDFEGFRKNTAGGRHASNDDQADNFSTSRQYDYTENDAPDLNATTQALLSSSKKKTSAAAQSYFSLTGGSNF